MMEKYTREVRDSLLTDAERSARWDRDQEMLGSWLDRRMAEEDREFARADDIGLSQAQANAQAALQAAEASAAALLAELEAKDAANDVAATVYKMPSPYAPGEAPRNPVSSVARPSAQESFQSALEGTLKPVNLDTLRIPTNTSSHVVDFAQKVRDAHKPGGNH